MQNLRYAFVFIVSCPRRLKQGAPDSGPLPCRSTALILATPRECAQLVGAPSRRRGAYGNGGHKGSIAHSAGRDLVREAQRGHWQRAAVDHRVMRSLFSGRRWQHLGPPRACQMGCLGRRGPPARLRSLRSPFDAVRGPSSPVCSCHDCKYFVLTHTACLISSILFWCPSPPICIRLAICAFAELGEVA